MTTRDELIKKNVVDHLFWDSRVDSSNVKVEVSDGIVSLSGTLSSLAACNVALEDTFDVSGVRNVIDKLQVELTPDMSTFKDEEIKQHIESALFLSPEIVSINFEVSVSDGCVIMHGSVPSYREKSKAAIIASEIPGVISMQNKLSVVPTRRFLDQQIAKDVVHALERHAGIDVEKIDVTVSGRKVTLSGTVPDGISFRASANVAAHTLGVVDVINNLEIQ
jgi:osmotically-inducible protein OsmY